MRLHSLWLLASFSLAFGCTEDEAPPAAEPLDPLACNTPFYGDGTCHANLACAQPDIDCFTVFGSNAEAEAAVLAMDAKAAPEQAREPYKALPTTDPTYSKMRELLSRGWAAYREEFPLGKLKDFVPELVILRVKTPNAFAFPVEGKAAFAVVVHEGLTTIGLTDEDMMYIMLHELTHVVRLHVAGQRPNRFYHVQPGQEPLGFQQVHMPSNENLIWNWINGSRFVRNLTHEHSGGLSFGGLLMHTFRALYKSIPTPTRSAECTTAHTTLIDVAAKAPYDDVVEASNIGTLAAGEVDASLAAVDRACSAQAKSLSATLQAQFSVKEAELPNEIPHVAEALASQTVGSFGQLAHLTRAIKKDMRDIEAKLAAANTPLAGVRWYNVEEQADDFAAIAMHRQGFLPATYRSAIVKLQDADLEPDEPKLLPRCEALLAAGKIPPYGPISDNHHASCFRAYHATALDQFLQSGGKYVVAGIARARSYDPPPVIGPIFN